MILNSNQLLQAQKVAKNPEVIKSRRILVMYKKDEPGLALFRVRAANMCNEILTRTIARKKLLKEARIWVNTWLNDPSDSIIGDAVKAFVNAIEQEIGRQVLR